MARIQYHILCHIKSVEAPAPSVPVLVTLSAGPGGYSHLSVMDGAQVWANCIGLVRAPDQQMLHLQALCIMSRLAGNARHGSIGENQRKRDWLLQSWPQFRV